MATVLAVEADSAAAQLLANLRLLGHDVVVAGDLTDALRRADGADVLVLAWPAMDVRAAQAMHEIESSGKRERLRVVLLTSRLAETEIAVGYEMGFDMVSPTPATATELDETLSRVLVESPQALRARRAEEVRRARLLAAVDEEVEE